MWKELRIAHYLGQGGSQNRTPLIHKPRQLRMLARSKDANMRYSVSRSSCATEEILWMLIRDESWVVRMGVAWHKRATLPMLELLLCDKVDTVREAALRSNFFLHHPLPHMDRLVMDESENIRMFLCRFESMPIDIALKLSRDKSSAVREKFFSSPAYLRILGDFYNLLP